jgi:hypothetical protein
MEDLRTRNESGGPDADQAALFRLAWFIGVALVFALMAPQPLFAATFSALLGIGSLALSLGAVMLREPVWPAHLTDGIWPRSSICSAAFSAGSSTVARCASSCAPRATPIRERTRR